MTRDPSDQEPGPDGAPEEPEGHLRPTRPGALVPWAAAGLVGGWLLRPVAERVQGTAPIVTWLQPLALLFVAAILGATAWITWRTVHVRREYLEPHRAVNRFVLARACALVGALVAGGYLGYGLSWVGIDTELGSQRMWRSLVAGLGGVAVAITGLLLERACRVRSEGPDA